MSWFIYIFGSGTAFFLGVGAILACLGLFVFCQRGWVKKCATVLVLVGLVAIAMSAIPLPYWLYGVCGAITLFWLVAERFPRGWLLARRNAIRGLLLAVWLIALILEIPHHVPANPVTTGRPTLYIIGDSVTAGLGGTQEVTWPRLLGASQRVEVNDFSRPGATLRSALGQASRLPKEGGLVLLEIGGNDLFGFGTAAEFERDLDELLSKVCQPHREVLMFELPLPPFENEIGRAQRRVAGNYGVVLIPRRIFVAVLTGDGATIDSVHLTTLGHERMAEVVWELIQPAYR